MSSIQEATKMYSPSLLAPFMFSCVLFALYSIINLIDMNEFILTFNITDIATFNRGKMIYSYLGGYYNLILKILLSLFIIFILTLVIRILVATILRVVIEPPQQQEGGMVGGAKAIQRGAANQNITRIYEAIVSNMRFILGFMINMSFIMLFLLTIPIFLLIVLCAYSQFYNSSNIINNTPTQSVRIILTHHNFLLFFIISLMLITFVYSIYLWFKQTYKK